MPRLMVVLFSLLVAFVPGTYAATIESSRIADGHTTILISGEIFRGDDERFATVAGTAPDETIVVMDSPGGNLVTGLRIGSAIRMRAWKTAVPDAAMCASACGLMWLGGVQRMVGQRARVGFHAASIVGSDGVRREVGSGNALVGSYLGRLGLTDDAVIYLTSASPEGAAWLTETMAKQVGIRAEFASLVQPRQVALVAPLRTPVPARFPAGVITGVRSGSRTALLEQLYANFPSSVRLANAESCVGRACKLRLVAEDTWTGSDGAERLTLVSVAEVKDDCHACLAILGIGQFRRSSSSEGWQKEILAPAVDRVGGYGIFDGKASFVGGGTLERVVLLERTGGGMGSFGSMVSLYAAVSGTFKQVLMVPLSLNDDATCDLKEAECRTRVRQSNYESRLSITVDDDRKVRVNQTFMAAIPVPPASWVIDGDGVAKQTAGGKFEPGSGAQERATLPSVAFDQGRADRVAYEAWFNGVQGEARAGAESWAGRRSLRTPGNCEPPAGQSSQWSAGCTTARQKLAAFDARRKTEPDYRRGWNSL